MKLEIINNEWRWQKIIKFQNRLKIHKSTEQKLFTRNYFGLKVKIWYQNLQNIEIWKHLWLRVSKLKLVSQLSSWLIFSNLTWSIFSNLSWLISLNLSWVIFSNLSRNVLNKFAVQSRGFKQGWELYKTYFHQYNFPPWWLLKFC